MSNRLGTQFAPDLGTRDTQLPAGGLVKMAANEDPTEHDVIVLNASGYGVASDGSQANARMGGVMFPDKSSTVSSVAGVNVVRIWNGRSGRMPMASAAGDAFTANDRMIPAYVSAAKEIGKAVVTAGIGRPLAGLMLFLDEIGAPVAWLGDVAQAVARGVVMADAFQFARFAIADASASATISERVIGRVTAHGVVTGVSYEGAALVIGDTDYATATIAKRSALDAYAAATTIATFDTRAAGTGAAAAFTPKSWTPSGTAANLRLVPGDVITLVTGKGGAGQSLIGAIDVAGKVI